MIVEGPHSLLVAAFDRGKASGDVVVLGQHRTKFQNRSRWRRRL
jgi:hypothetical protein